ncbi:FixH family protein [Microbulbifer halophilus]|uniref:FixH family protein n=1 Tax=Microbulbifer halophilus TaxID=453963 RepID=A0ABW5ECD9_9GAMM|nr:FixH family protein [Microbulbifer halophilus]MCW8125268.1 FixH family protein [Microbulbifer halophilus]
MNTMTENPKKPWYREFWLWVVLFPLILTLVASATMVSIAVLYADDTVSDTYHKDSRMYHYTAEQDERARELGLAGMLQFRRGENVVTLDLNGQLEYPQQLLLTMSHPVEEDMDRHILLQRSGGRYTGSVPGELQHRWYLRLMPELNPQQHLDAGWRLKGEINFDLGDAAPLNPAVQ